VRFPLQSARVYTANHRYGNGLDSTPRVQNDPELCNLLHGVFVNDCHFDSTVWTGPEQRAAYEVALMGGCPVWHYRSGAEFGPCHDDRTHAAVSCDHFGSAYQDGRDDPQTPAFEGEPKACGRQRDEYGPMAGFFTIPQCPGESRECAVRSCPPNDAGGANCGPWVLVDWK
jgi:hypothetical protein